MAGRINASQGDEIGVHAALAARAGERCRTPPHMMRCMRSHDVRHGHARTNGELAASNGIAFDRLFLTLMITHHDGAVKWSRNFSNNRVGLRSDAVRIH